MKLILSLGSNLGNKEQNLNRAIEQIEQKIGSVVKVSSFLHSEPFGFTSDNSFVNAVVEVNTKLGIYRVLKITQKIEQLMGRQQKSHDGIHYDRIIDIDILYYASYKTNTRKLTVPHPRINEREFVLKPLSELYNKTTHCQ
ncbi:MAG: 2-amino-4-hydroxy-6-hydroxymethyldihydropteridine diphosphokinase [Bacteroidales bacterium]|nr:MAG: 2-amino-4-hydroxy-6-hydroxymethyldihydropteridine diphosphokinase [Bacteroidales bacterium]